MNKSVVEEIKYEQGQQNLTEAQEQAIAQEALKEVHQEKEEESWENPAENQENEEEVKPKEDDKGDEENKPKEEKETPNPDDKPTDDKSKVPASDPDKDIAGKKDEVKPFQIPVENRQKLIEELALKESLTLEEAEAQIIKDEATINKFKNDPVEMARALRHSQREYDKTKTELDNAKKSISNPVPVVNSVKEYVQSQLEPIKDKVIDSYKKEYPELVEGQTDEYIFGLIKKDAIDRTMKVMEENQSKLVSAAKEKRANLILGLSEQDKAFLPDIKAILDRTSDKQIMAKEYDIKYIIEWAQGKQMKRLVQEAEDRGFKRGQEQAKIIGEKLPKGKTPESSGGSKKSALNEVQKERALNMFDSVVGMSDQEKYDAYVETYPEEFKK